MRVPMAVHIALSLGLALGLGVSDSASAQVPTTETQPRLVVPRTDAVIQTTAPTAAPTEPAPVTAVTGSTGVTTIGTTPEPTASSSQAVMADTRSYVASKFGLTLGGVQAGWLRSAEGGTAMAEVVTEKVGPDLVSKKHLAGVTYEPITVVADFQSPGLTEWIAASWKGNYSRKNGSILEADYDYTVKAEREFFNAIVAETKMPALDAASKDAAYMTVKLAPEYTRLQAGSGKATISSAKSTLKWMPAYFRFEMAGLDGSKVNKIDAFTVRQTVTESPVGEARDYQKEPSAIEFPNLKVTLAATSGQSWLTWHDDFVIKGNNGADQERSGSIVYLDSYMKTELGRVNLSNCGIFRLTPEPVVAGAETIRRLVAELYCEKMELVPNGKAQ